MPHAPTASFLHITNIQDLFNGSESSCVIKIMKMTAIFLTLIIIITTGAKQICLEAKSDAVSEVKFDKSYSEDVFQQMQTTSEITPAPSTGNKVNDVTSTVLSKSLEAQEENFLAISPITTSGKNSIEEKNNDLDEGNAELLKTSELTATKQNKTANSMHSTNLRKAINLPPALNVIWENCLESAYREHNKINFKPQRQLEVAKNLQVLNNRIGGNVWDKRDVDGTKSVAIKAWLDKYNNLKNANKDKTGQSNETTDVNEVSILTKTTKPVTFEVFSITKKLLNEQENLINSTLSSAVTENNIRASNSIEWFEEMDQSKIKFNSLPQMQNYLVPKFKLEQGYHPFTFVAGFFSIIYPFDFPIGLAKDIIWGQVTFPLSFIQSIKVESTFLAFVVLFACIALIIPTYLIILGIIYLLSKSSCNDEAESGALFPEQEGSSCVDKFLVFMTFFTVIICCTLICGMVLSNEQSHVAAMSSRNVVNCACADIATWLSVAARELHYSLVPPIDLVLYAYQEDLKNVDTFLGEPIQQAIASESGIDLVLDSLADIIAESEDLSSKVSALRNISIKAGTLAAVAADRLDDLARQIDGLKKQCSAKDAPLCDTINTHSMELKLKFNSILKEQQLLELRALGVDNLTLAIATAKQELRSLPSLILSQTKEVRDSILRDIEIRRDKVHSSARILTDIVRYLTADLHSFSRQLDASFERIQIYEFWRWIFLLVCTVVCALVMMLMLVAMLCGCGKAKIHAKRTLQLSAVWICFASLLLWSVISAVFLIAGHAEVFLCQTLWDSAQYKTLSKLLDRPSPLLENNEGFFDAMFRDLDNVTIEVSVRDVLRDCERNRPAYVVFQLDRILDVNKETSYFEWEELQADLGRLSTAVDVSFLKSISAPFNRILNEILVKSNVNLPLYRMEYNNPVVGKDLPALEDQLENVAAQISDLTTSGRLETLAKRTERVYLSNIKPLEQLRADLVFKLTELELQLIPYRRRLNISLSHIHTAQFYIDNQGDVIAQKVSAYVSRLVSHAARWRSHVLTSTGKHAARCQPLFAVYAAVRALLCTKYISSLHGWWLCGVVLGLLWCILLTPLCVNLWRTYERRMNTQDFITLSNFNTAPQGTPETEPCENGNWTTPGSVPGPPPPPRDDNW